MVAKKKRTRNRYSPEFKMGTARLLQSGRKQSELGINESMIREWSKQAEIREGLPAEEVLPGNGRQTRQGEEIRRLKRELEQVRMERDFLKEAAAYFAKEDRE